ncbi:MAG: RES domain-containing protein [Firmicutes bacterium]|nr:RES domain-containing protein [Bacillota bacterium]
MTKKKNILCMWEKFKESIIYNNRFFPENEELINKLNNILSVLTKLSRGHTVGDLIVYRARKGRYYYETDIRKPDSKKVYIDDGRCNPRGISYFYVANNEITAIREVRPEKNEIVSIGVFKNKESLRISNFNSINLLEQHLFNRQILNEEERSLLDILLIEISKPINSKQSLEYIPIQYVVEYIKQYYKKNSFDGFSFDSSFQTGKNYVFFDDIKFELVDKIKHCKAK